MLVAGRYRWEIISELSKEWNCTTKNVDKYISASKKVMSSHFSKETVEDILSKYNYLYQIAIEKGDARTANRILDSIAKVSGKYIEKVEHVGDINFNVIKLKEMIRDDSESKE